MMGPHRSRSRLPRVLGILRERGFEELRIRCARGFPAAIPTLSFSA